MKRTLPLLLLAALSDPVSFADTPTTPSPTYQIPVRMSQVTPKRLQPEKPTNPKRPQDNSNFAIYYIIADGNLFIYSTDSVMGEVIVTTDQSYTEIAHAYTDLGVGFSCDVSSEEFVFLTVVVDSVSYRN